MIQLILLLSIQDGLTALMLASKNGHIEIVKYLVESEALIDLQTQVDYTLNPFISYFKNVKITYKTYCT